MHHAQKLGYESALVRTPDTDIFMILLHHVASINLVIYIDIGTKKREIINITELAGNLGAEYCTALLGLYIFTGEDAKIGRTLFGQFLKSKMPIYP